MKLPPLKIRDGGTMTTDHEYLLKCIQDGTMVPPGTYLVDAPVVVPEGKTLLGSGNGITTIKMTPTAPGEIRPAVVMMSDRSTVKGILADSRDALCNGIVAENVTGYSILECGVMCHSAHTYHIWSHNSSKGLISCCSVDGNTSTLDNSVPQEGIEVFGGSDITVDGCIIVECGRAGINLFQDQGARLAGCTVRNCTVRKCSYGLFACAQSGSQLTGAVFHDNQIQGCGVRDIKVTAGPGCVMDVVFESRPGSFATAEVNTECKTCRVVFNPIT